MGPNPLPLLLVGLAGKVRRGCALGPMKSDRYPGVTGVVVAPVT